MERVGRDSAQTSYFESMERTHGKLKIFFGYAEGMGKTCAMLEAAHQAKRRNVDLVVGYLEPHTGIQMQSLVKDLEQIPAKMIQQGKEYHYELDIDAALKRKPQLILIDELAHINAKGSRHIKRYQDVQELLDAGIDVYTTVNVQNIESLNDIVTSITGTTVKERIPDSVFDQADQVELVDMEPSELLERISDSDGYREELEKEGKLQSFTKETLTSLREIALRRCADRVNLLTEQTKALNGNDYYPEESILVCLSSSPSNAKIIRTAARMARAFHGKLIALYVESSKGKSLSDVDKKRLEANMHLAKQLGAVIETTYGEDIPYQIAEFVRLSGVSRMVIGRSMVKKKSIFSEPALTERLISMSSNLEIHIIPDLAVSGDYRPVWGKKTEPVRAKDILKSILVLIAATIIGCIFYQLGITEANIVAAYIFGVFLTSIITANRICGVISSLFSVLLFNFFFTIPRFTLHFNDPDYLLTFMIMFIVAFLTGSLALKLQDNARQSARAAFRTKTLFETSQLLQKGKDEESVLNVTAGQLTKLLKRDIVIYPADKKGLKDPKIYRSEESSLEELEDTGEKEAANWVFHNNKHAGATTETFSNAECLYLSIRTNEGVYGIVGIVLDGNPLDAFENSVLLSILGECALALENEKNAREKAEAALMAEKEQLRANLLRSISHDLRTPLTSISGNASNLLANEGHFDEKTKKQLYSDIYDDSMWLYNLVENLLSVTKIEEGRFQLHLSTELLDEVITESLRHINRKKTEHHIIVRPSEEFLLIKADARLIMQVIINLIDNAIKYTQKDSEILITTRKEKNQAVVCIADNGPGISDEMKPYIFDMFYSGAKSIADSRRSLGLGLALCKSIIQAHGGVLKVTDNVPHGAVFTFSLPLEEVDLHE